MARGTSQSQSSSTSRSGPVGVPPRGSATATADMRPRRLGGTSSRLARFSSGAGSGGGGSNMLRFYTDDAPGLKITAIVVLVMSVCFIRFVTAPRPYRSNASQI